MQIVIEIPEEEFRKVRDERASVSMMREAIRDGVVLPETHGRLIDAEIAEDRMFDYMCGTGFQYDAVSVLQMEYYTPTVIEAREKVQE